ncbi:glycosyltransferase [Pseudodesulfovibrio portus]|uniref:Glycosyl transferase family 1 domain-containing protein n=1 Tax=Pseudodesulfovibrio portus TaxID=231439 RepID=A0ABM8ATX3_9BACT|nr:glycosyltransferase [Pseudodesulfovibrio portus]BDQ34695.1 hypothetical protein JCM14722_22370 [Pseudodesulfovibrio portus]
MRTVKLLIPYDVEGWAWWHKAQAVKRLAHPPVAVDVVRFGQPLDHRDFDYVLPFGHYMLSGLAAVPPEKILLGSSSNLPEYLDKTAEALRTGKCRALFANSLMGYEALKPAGRVFLCQNGVDADLFHPVGQPPAELTCCWVGNPNSEGLKGFDLIEEACRKTGAVLRHVACDATKGDETGIISQSDIRDRVYRQAHAYICASANEATPNPALEALACGLPVITTAVGNMPEIIEDGVNGFFVDRSVDSIAKAIERLRRADWSAMSRAARASIENGWTWEHKVRNYENMAFELAGEDGLLP